MIRTSLILRGTPFKGYQKLFVIIFLSAIIFFCIVVKLTETSDKGEIFTSEECSNIVFDYYEKSSRLDLSSKFKVEVFADRTEISNICDDVINMYNEDESQLLERVNARLKYNRNITSTK